MRRSARFLAMLAAAGLLSCVTPTSSTAEPAVASGFADIASCIAAADNVLVSVVVDESLSLRQSDPEALRVQGITTAVDSLEQLAASVEAQTEVHVSLSTFARSYETLFDWQQLDQGTAKQLRDVAEQDLPSRTDGDATDYREALLGAKQQMEDQQQALGDPGACKVLLWFTDGALDVDEQTEVAGEELCRVGGVADALRADGIAVVALALFTPGADVDSAQRNQLKAIAEGNGQTTSCGRFPLAPSSTRGVYLPAEDASALQQLFAGAGALVAGGTAVDSVRCPSNACPGGSYDLSLDTGVAGARLLVATAQPAAALTVTSPSGRPVTIRPGPAVKTDGAEISLRARGGLMTLDVTYSALGHRQDRWQVAAPERSQVTVYWFWGVTAEMVTTSVDADASTEVQMRLLDREGRPVDLALYDHVEPALTVGDSAVPARVQSDGRISAQLELEAGDLAPTLDVRGGVAAMSRPSGVTLGPVTFSGSLAVTLPKAYPVVTSDVLDFGHFDGSADSATATLPVQGSPLGATTVCLTTSRVTLPGRDTPADLVSAGSQPCLQLDADEKAELSLAMSPNEVLDGVAGGEVSLTLTPAGEGEPRELSVPALLELERPIDQGTRWLLIAALVATAVLVPLALLVGSNFLLGRFTMTATSRVATKSVRVTAGGLEGLDGPSHGPLLTPDDFENAAFSGIRRQGRMPLGNAGLTLRTTNRFSLRDPRGVAVAPVDRLLVSSVAPHRSARHQHEAPAPLGEVDAAFVVVGPLNDDGTAEATLVMAVPGHVDTAGVEERLGLLKARPDWRKVLDELQPPPAAPEPSSHVGAVEAHPDVASGFQVDQDESTLVRLPWDSEPAFDAPAEPLASRRHRGFRRAATSTPESSPPSTNDLPPLPDFLK